MKRIVLVVDDYRWAWSHMAHGIKKYAPDGMFIEIVTAEDFGKRYSPYNEKLNDVDAVCQFSWPESSHSIPCRNVGVVAHHGMEAEYPPTSFLDKRLATSVRNNAYAKRVLPRFDAVLCHSTDLTTATGMLNNNAVYCPPGVDHESFHLLTRFESTVGWCGQKPTPGFNNSKGFDLCEMIQHHMLNDGCGHRWLINRATAKNAKPPQDMRDSFYGNIKTFVCTAIREGGPLTVLEALACGRPVVTTNVGVVNEMIDMDVSRNCPLFVVPPYDTEVEMKERVEWMSHHIHEIMQLNHSEYWPIAIRARELALKFSWKQLSPLWCKHIVGETD